MKNIQLNNRFLQKAATSLRRSLNGLPYLLLIERFRLLRLVLLVLLGVVALYVVVRLFYFEASDAAHVTSLPIVFQTEAIDELEVWLEDRHSEWEREIVDGRRQYFDR
jgi:hypothetical protein